MNPLVQYADRSVSWFFMYPLCYPVFGVSRSLCTRESPLSVVPHFLRAFRFPLFVLQLFLVLGFGLFTCHLWFGGNSVIGVRWYKGRVTRSHR